MLHTDRDALRHLEQAAALLNAGRKQQAPAVVDTQQQRPLSSRSPSGSPPSSQQGGITAFAQPSSSVDVWGAGGKCALCCRTDPAVPTHSRLGRPLCGRCIKVNGVEKKWETVGESTRFMSGRHAGRSWIWVLQHEHDGHHVSDHKYVQYLQGQNNLTKPFREFLTWVDDWRKGGETVGGRYNPEHKNKGSKCVYCGKAMMPFKRENTDWHGRKLHKKCWKKKKTVDEAATTADKERRRRESRNLGWSS